MGPDTKGFEVKLDLLGMDDPLSVARLTEQGFIGYTASAMVEHNMSDIQPIQEEN